MDIPHLRSVALPTSHADSCAAPRPVWRDGWLWPCLQERSPNFGLRPEGIDISLVVVHSISLPPGEYGGDAVRQLFTNTLPWDAHPYFESIRGMEVSSHFFVRRNGTIWQFVDTEKRAWHAGTSSYQGRANCNDYSVGIELEGLEGMPFDAPQYQSLTWLCRALCMRHPISDITGHEHIAPGRKHDPGAAFEWTRLRDSLADLALCIAPGA